MGFPRQEYWSGLPFPPFPEDLHNSGIEPMSPVSPALAGRFFITETPRKPSRLSRSLNNIKYAEHLVADLILWWLLVLQCRATLLENLQTMNVTIPNRNSWYSMETRSSPSTSYETSALSGANRQLVGKKSYYWGCNTRMQMEFKYFSCNDEKKEYGEVKSHSEAFYFATKCQGNFWIFWFLPLRFSPRLDGIVMPPNK